MALVMDIYIPTGNRNRAGVIRIMCGGMLSSPNWSHRVTDDRAEVRSLLEAGYVVFAVAHSCQPKYTIDEAYPDITLAVRFIRHNAGRFGIEPECIGIMGASCGGHLSLLVEPQRLQHCQTTPDPVDHESPRVQAVVAYYAGTDNLNFGRENTTIAEHFRAQGRPTGEFDFHQWDKESQRFERITDPEMIRQRFRETSPIDVKATTAPVLLLHGDKDTLVPLQQSEVFIGSLRQAGVPNTLFVVGGIGHGYSNGWEKPQTGEIETILDWFNQHFLGIGGSVRFVVSGRTGQPSNTPGMRHFRIYGSTLCGATLACYSLCRPARTGRPDCAPNAVFFLAVHRSHPPVRGSCQPCAVKMTRSSV